MRWTASLLLALAAALALAGCERESAAPEPVDPAPGDETRSPGDPPEARALRERMVTALRGELEDLDPRVVLALQKVPRHLFVPHADLARAYAWTDPLDIGEGQTISSPEVVAVMSSRLGLTGKEKVLEIGTGSGYQAAILAELVPEVYTIEIIPALADRARRRLASMGYENVHVKTGDGYQGWAEHAPFDAIIVTAAPPETPPALLDQLAPGGRMILPVGPRHRTQRLLLHRKGADGGISTEKGFHVRFVPMVHPGER